jgi:hypothetical protein
VKTMAGVIVLAGLLAEFPAESMAQTFWIRLSGNRVILDARILRIDGDSIVIVKDEKKGFVPIGQLESIRRVEEGSILEGAALGAGVGLAVGAAVGSVLESEENVNWTPATAALYGAVLGGIVGSVTGSSGSSEVLELKGRGIPEKKQLIESFLSHHLED